MLLAGDVGGTKTRLGLFDRGAARPVSIEIRQFDTLDFADLGTMVAAFLTSRIRPGDPIEAACFGVAGPVLGHSARLTNVPWEVDALRVAQRHGIATIGLLNDLTALGHAVPVLGPDELAVLQEGGAVTGGNAALIAAGTGLGEALLHSVGGRFVPSPSEGGHADFAPRTPREIELLEYLIATCGRAHYEHVLSGPGLVNLYRFTHPEACGQVDLTVDPVDLPARISAAGFEKRCTRCVEALDIFVSVYGAEAGNLGMRSVATAGVFVGGGIAPKILPALQAGGFLEAFRAKEPMVDLMMQMPVAVILNAEAGLLGAAVYAAALTQ
ncbi:MAG: glucokinase [Acidobacteria bacterium]|nr:glucokinase [Acidobacteriota bacterium]